MEIQRIARDFYEKLHYANDLENLEEMDFLETCNLLQLNHEEKENLNRLTTSMEIESIIVKLQIRKPQDPMAPRMNSSKHLKNRGETFSNSPKNLKWMSHF